jgi:hypothetical protein
MIIRRWALIALLVASSASWLAGCAVGGTTDGRPAEQIVLERAQARWNALLAGNWAAAYKFSTPGYRAVVSEQTYGNQFRGPLQWHSAKASKAECEERRCLVYVRVEFTLFAPGQMGKRGQTDLEETWVFEDNNWYRFETL